MRPLLKEKSDAEFIEAIRKKVERPNWSSPFHYGMSVFFLLAFGFVWGMAHRLKDIFPDEYADMLTSGFSVGIILGSFAALMLMFAILSISWGVEEYSVRRVERLLIRFYDQLHGSTGQSDAGGRQ